MHIEEGVEIGLGGFGDAGVVRDAGIIDEDVEAIAAELGQHLPERIDELRERGTVSRIERQGSGAASHRFGEGDHAIGFALVGPVGDDHVEPTLGEILGGVAAQAAAAARDEGDTGRFGHAGSLWLASSQLHYAGLSVGLERPKLPDSCLFLPRVERKKSS